MNRRMQRMGIAILAVTRAGTLLGAQIVSALQFDAEVTVYVRGSAAVDPPPEAVPYDESLATRVTELFPEVEALVFVLSLEATVQLIAPLIGRRQEAPAILCVDDAGRFVIPVLGGKHADVNDLAHSIAEALDGTAVITTANEPAGPPRLDRLGADAGWIVEASPETLTQATKALLAGQTPAVYLPPEHQEPGLGLPGDWPRVESLGALRAWAGPRIVVTDRLLDPAIVRDGGPLVVYRPRTLALGVGCTSDAAPEDVVALARAAVAGAGFAWGSVHTVATIESLLMHPALVKLVWEADAQFFPVYTAEELAAVTDLASPSAEVARRIGAAGVSEPAAILASDGGDLLVPKWKSASATVAVARRKSAAPEARVSQTDGLTA